MDMRYLIKDLLITRDLQKWVNNRFKDPNKLILDSYMVDWICARGIKFYVSSDMKCIKEAFEDYFFDDIRSDDIVIDIGGNIGAFCLQAAKKAKHVYVVEPIRTNELKANIKLNNAHNITVVEKGLGDGTTQKISWHNTQKEVETIPLSEIIGLCGGRCDFLKCDCEGAEWCISEDEFRSIRRIELEYHQIKPNQKDNLIRTLSKFFKLEIKEVSPAHNFTSQGIIHAFNFEVENL